MIYLHFILAFVGLFIAQEILRRFPKIALVVFAVAPLILLPHWLNSGITDWFSLAKVYSVALGIIWISLFRLTIVKESKISKAIVYLLLFANILEAVIKDAITVGIAHNLNFFTGIMLLLTLGKIDSIGISDGRLKDLEWKKIDLGWIVGYTVWNWTFVYLNFPTYSFHHLAVLGIPLAVAFFDKKRWAQTRAYTLGVYLLLFFSMFPEMTKMQFHWNYQASALIISCTSFLFVACFCLKAIYKKQNLF